MPAPAPTPNAAPFGCPVCGLALNTPGPCPNRWCARADRYFSVVFPVGVHTGALRHAVSRYKYSQELGWAAVFARVIAGYLRANACWFEDFHLITAVPSYQGPGASRAWDPVGRILRQLAPLVDPEWSVVPAAVQKRAETPRMQALTWSQRQLVAAGPLRRALVVPAPALVAEARILVLDDVMTEGSTLREVARALRAAGAREVAGLVLSRPDWSA